MSSTNPPSNDSNDYFYPGSIVKCVTCYGAEVQGEVIAFDHNTKILVLSKCRCINEHGVFVPFNCICN